MECSTTTLGVEGEGEEEEEEEEEEGVRVRDFQNSGCRWTTNCSDNEIGRR